MASSSEQQTTEPISLPPISEFSTRFRVPVSPPLSNNNNKRVKRDTALSDPPILLPSYRHWEDQPGSPPPTPPTDSSAQVLAEKRRRNAGASARFRERRKLRERELQETCKALDRRVFALESALKQLDPHHSLLVSNHRSSVSYSLSPEPDHHPPSSPGSDHALVDRVSQLEHLMTLFQQENKSTKSN